MYVKKAHKKVHINEIFIGFMSTATGPSADAIDPPGSFNERSNTVPEARAEILVRKIKTSASI